MSCQIQLMRARPAACMHRLAERKRNGVSVCCERAPGPCERHWLFVFWLPLRVALRLLRVPDTVRAWTRARATSARSTGHSPAAMTATARSTRLPLRFRRHNAALCAVGRVALVVHSLHPHSGAVPHPAARPAIQASSCSPRLCRALQGVHSARPSNAGSSCAA